MLVVERVIVVVSVARVDMQELNCIGGRKRVLESIIAVVEDGAQEAEEQIREEEAELTRMETRESVVSRGGGDRRPSVVETDFHAEVQKPKQFTQDEERERGAVSMGIYRVYMMASGGWVFDFS